MNTRTPQGRIALLVAAGALVLTTGCSAMKNDAGAAKAVDNTATAIDPTPMPAGTPMAAMGAGAMLSGSQEVPPNPSAATGKSMLMVAPDMSVSGAVEVMGMTPTAAHIHEAAPGSNGPVIVPLTKTGDHTFAAPAGARLTDAQYAAYKAGKLYVNVHSAQYPNGEIRMQMLPK